MESTPNLEVQRQAWHKPTVSRLDIAVDTRLGRGSVIDQDGFEFFGDDTLGAG